jgi:hypothetical protein
MPVAARQREVGARDLDANPVTGRKVVGGGHAADPDVADLTGHEPGWLIEAVEVAQPQEAAREVVGGAVWIDVYELDEHVGVLDIGRDVEFGADVADDCHRFGQHGRAVDEQVCPALDLPLIDADRGMGREAAT